MGKPTEVKVDRDSRLKQEQLMINVLSYLTGQDKHVDNAVIKEFVGMITSLRGERLDRIGSAMLDQLARGKPTNDRTAEVRKILQQP